MSSLPEIQSFDWNVQEKILMEQKDIWGFECIYLIDNDGVAYYPGGESSKIESDYLADIKKKQEYITEPWVNNEKTISVTTVIIPVKDSEGNIREYMCGTINLKNINDIIQRINIGENGYAFIVNKEGTIVAHKDMNVVLDKKSIFDGNNKDEIEKFMKNIVDRQSGSAEISLDGEKTFASYTPIEGTNWSVVLVVSKASTLKVVSDIARVEIILLIGAIAAGVIMSLFMKKT